MITAAIDALRAGRPVVVVDHADRENEGDLILPAEFATPEWIGFMVRYTSGVLCVALTGPTCDRLDLPPMTTLNRDPKGTAYTVSVDAREGITTGISASERAKTIRLLANPTSVAGDFTRPGHVFPLRAHPKGVHGRPGHTEAAVDLARIAGLNPAGVIGEIVDDLGEPLRGAALKEFAQGHGLVFVTIDEVIEAVPQPTEVAPSIAEIASATLPTHHGDFDVTAFRGKSGEHLAISHGDLNGEVPLRIHSECLTGDALSSLRCDCGPQLDSALEQIQRDGGLVIYMRGHEGRGIGLANKIHAYSLQDKGLDTVDANLELGLPVDARDWSDAVAILKKLKVSSVRLMTNNPEKVRALREAGIEVTQVQHEHGRSDANERYLITKAERLAHSLTRSL